MRATPDSKKSVAAAALGLDRIGPGKCIELKFQQAFRIDSGKWLKGRMQVVA